MDNYWGYELGQTWLVTIPAIIDLTWIKWKW